ncbi:MAG TPA: histidine kinase N-terminal 7TM domain-containing protein, partial [Spirochaetota bacterium]|nr:histidine kinase N-terminal 7TM domain-containing protein [Spirochaetota bacterium]
MNIISALAVIVMFINISAGIYVLTTDPAHKMNRLFFLQCMSLAVWSLTAVIIYSSNSRTDIVFWYRVSSFGFGLYYVFTLHLCLLFIRAKLMPARLIAMYIPAIVIIAMTWFSYTLFEDFIFTGARWKFIPAFSHAGFYIYALYYLSFVIITVTGMIRWESRAESQKEIHQSRIIAPSYIATVVVCTLTDFILPSFPFYKLPALAPVLLVINTGSILYTIYKYNFLTPVRDIFDSSLIQTYPGRALLVNRRRRIITVNNEFCDYFGCSKEDVSGMHMNNWFSADQALVERIGQLVSGDVKTCSGMVKYGSSGKIQFRAECSLLADKFDDFIGILIILNSPVETVVNADADAELIAAHGPDDYDERMNADKDWGIDLTGRKMWYQPWPVDENGLYREPSADEIETTYCISGEAVNETLFYFEECGGDSERLVTMLNEHMAGKMYIITRHDLLDAEKWYSNEFYFYFIMFTKKVIGRYDFHFGENSSEQLSEHHKIYEKGFMEFIPYGKTVSGTPVHDVTTNNVLGLLLYLEKVLLINTSDIISFINNNLNSRYSIDRDFYNNENIWCSLEFIEYGFEFTKIFANANTFFIKAAIYSTLNELRIGKLFFLIPRQVVLSQLKSGISKANDIHNFKIDLGRGFARFIITIKPDFNISQYSKYLNASIPNDAAVYHGSLAAVIKLIFSLKDLPGSTLSINNIGGSRSFTISYRWQPAKNIMYNKIIVVILISIFAGLGLIYTGIISHCLAITLLSLVIFYFYTEKTNLSERLSEYTIVSNQQLEALEKTSAELLEEHNTLEQKVIERTRELALAN